MSRRNKGRLGNEGYQRRLRSATKDRERQQREDLRGLLADPAGRRVLWWLLNDVTKVYDATFTGNSQTFHNEGRRSVGVDLRNKLLEVAPVMYVTMMSEQMEELEEYNLQKREADASFEMGEFDEHDE